MSAKCSQALALPKPVLERRIKEKQSNQTGVNNVGLLENDSACGVLNAGQVSGTCGDVNRLWTQLLHQLQRSPYGLVLANEGFLGCKKKQNCQKMYITLNKTMCRKGLTSQPVLEAVLQDHEELLQRRVLRVQRPAQTQGGLD